MQRIRANVALSLVNEAKHGRQRGVPILASFVGHSARKICGPSKFAVVIDIAGLRGLVVLSSSSYPGLMLGRVSISPAWPGRADASDIR